MRMGSLHAKFPAKAQRRKDSLWSAQALSLRLCAFAGAFLIVAACVFSLTAGSSAQSPSNETRGLAELQKGDYDNAFKLLSARLSSAPNDVVAQKALRSEEHTSELQSLAYLVCRLLLEKKKKNE